jgi:predicted RNA-binding Zn-ribbon protein involved in translation (DUF1610 family)
MAEPEDGYDYGAYCGLYCGACAILLASERGEVEKLLAYEEDATCTAEQLSCRGCRTEIVAYFCADCEMRRCAGERGVPYCVNCDEYPCEQVRAFQADKHPHHSIILKNLAAVAERGSDVWLAEQAERWSCPECGARFAWYDKRCDECGAKLYDCRAEERDLPD